MRPYVYALVFGYGYVLGTITKHKPLYYAEYYLPSSINPRVEKYAGQFKWMEDYEEKNKRELRNALYYERLLKQMHE